MSQAGFLEKRKKGGLLAGTGWKKGFWVLSPAQWSLKEFENTDGKVCVSELDIRNLDSVVREQEKNATMMVLVFKDLTRFTLKCDNEVEREDWIHAIEELQEELTKSGFNSVKKSEENVKATMTPPMSPLPRPESFRTPPSPGGGSTPPSSPEMTHMNLSPNANLPSSSPVLSKSASKRSLLRVASTKLSSVVPPLSPMNRYSAKASALDSPKGSVGSAPSPSGTPVSTPKKSLYEKEKHNSEIFMNKARSLASSINRGHNESMRLKTGVTLASKGSDGSSRNINHHAAVLPSFIQEQSVPPEKFMKSAQQRELLIQVVSKEFADFGNLAFTESPQTLVDLMYSVQVPKDQKFIIQGENVDRLFVLETGSVGVYTQDFASRPMELEYTRDKPGEAFGLLSIVYNQPGMFTIKSHSICNFWVLSRQKFHETVTKEVRKKVTKKLHMLEKIPLLAENLDKNLLDQLAESVEFEVFPQGKDVVKQGDHLKRVIVICDGNAKLVRDGKEVALLKKGDVFGEGILLNSRIKVTSDSSLVATSSNLTFLGLSPEEIEDLVGPLKQFLLKRWKSSQNSNRLAVAAEENANAMAKGVTNKSAPVTQTAIQAKAEVTPMIDIIKASDEEIEAEMVRQMTIAVKRREQTQVVRLTKAVKKLSHTDDPSTTTTNQQSSSSSTVKLQDEIKEEEEDEGKDDEADDKTVSEGDSDENLDKPFEKAEPLRKDIKQISDLAFEALLGKGNFGTVHRVKRDGQSFALKVVRGDYIVSNGWEYSIENERDAMLEISAMNSAFLIKMYSHFSDRRNIYFLMEICEGGSLANLAHTTSSKRLSEDSAKFYVACVVLALESLHSREICYRDLKPENVMLDNLGYCKLIDFGLAKKTLRTFTVCGTPEYTAPEVLHRVGHASAVDWWALGILLYEICGATTPFCGFEPMDVYNAILAHETAEDIVYPDTVEFSPLCKDIISQLLHPKKSKRLGVKFPGVQGLKNHKFFQGFDWKQLEERKMQPAIKPQLDTVALALQEGAGDYDFNSFINNPEDKTQWTAKFSA